MVRSLRIRRMGNRLFHLPAPTPHPLLEDFVVPLELPAVDSHTDASSAVVPAAERAPQQESLTPEQAKQLDAVGWRMLNLPLIVCQSANGMPFFFPLQKVSLPHQRLLLSSRCCVHAT